MATATQDKHRCGSTDTGDGSPCENMVSDPDQRCGHHAEDEDTDAGDDGAVMSRDQWESTVEDVKDELSELRTQHRDLQRAKEKALATFPQDQQQLDDLDAKLDRTRDLIERAEARLQTLQDDVKQKVLRSEAQDHITEAEDLAASIREEAEAALPRAKEAVQTLADTLLKILPAARRVRFIQKCLDELADLHDLDAPDLDTPPSMYDLDDSGELDEIDPRDIWESATGANAQARNAGNVLTRSRRDGAELQDVISTRIENAREDWTD